MPLSGGPFTRRRLALAIDALDQLMSGSADLGQVGLGAVLGIMVSRATATLPQTTTAPIFTITGGRVLVNMILGEVTTVIQTQANNTKLELDPESGAANSDICANLNITGDIVGTMYQPMSSSGGASAMIDNLQQVLLVAQRRVFAAGDIALTCSASNTGSIKWDIWYVPIDTGATIVAV